MEFNYIFNIFFKIFSLLAALIYLIFSIVLLKQIRIMVNTLKDSLNLVIILISDLQLIVALILLILVMFFI